MSKGERVRDMFDELAPHYDQMNRIMTLGQDQRWRRFAIERAALRPGAHVLDLASGTGDIALEIARRDPSAEVIAGDFALQMMTHGRARPGGDRIRWVGCDAMRLPFAKASFDAVLFAYLLRNVEAIDVALGEVFRVLKPGGRVVCLDTMPPRGITAPFVRAYLKLGLPIMGRLFARNPDAYNYLSDSTMGFRDPEALASMFSAAGFSEVDHRTFMFQTVAVHWALRPPSMRSST